MPREALAEIELPDVAPEYVEPSQGRLLLRSPVDGTVLRVLEESDRTMTPGKPILEIGDVRDLEVVADYLSEEAVRIRPGMLVLVDGWSGDDDDEPALRATVRLVEPAGFTKVSALGVEEQRVNVIMDPAGGDGWAPERPRRGRRAEGARGHDMPRA